MGADAASPLLEAVIRTINAIPRTMYAASMDATQKIAGKLQEYADVMGGSYVSGDKDTRGLVVERRHRRLRGPPGRWRDLPPEILATTGMGRRHGVSHTTQQVLQLEPHLHADNGHQLGCSGGQTRLEVHGRSGQLAASRPLAKKACNWLMWSSPGAPPSYAAAPRGPLRSCMDTLHHAMSAAFSFTAVQKHCVGSHAEERIHKNVHTGRDALTLHGEHVSQEGERWSLSQMTALFEPFALLP
ncbi:hypothetical protein VOLCADRAFT_99762 [Volvox carteri f. nagariensis]|uniref:Uncharacterized protein n=1 Tax=Volvox carteri f. nagariensis TaxID=3068 RepID=D8UIK9_VOLCA|nr:uncharacterized protein VOLCADRAFT_99762 [Volvox carteri f. nagariensis]EFJ40413.1 hypothetical protein VOLCADRAFT_99762 [Volvox carteri f. nagariensis]|eukprot:XP_002958493.1 hypothetical protein VOLCADRAFT_99762 [Volvox carteri f. nagariensis]